MKKFTQKQLLAFTANMETSLICLEACSRGHFRGRALRDQGHDLRLITAQFVKAFLKSNKNDFIDAKVIAEAVCAQAMIVEKSVEEKKCCDNLPLEHWTRAFMSF